MIFDTFSDIKIDVVPLNNIKSEVTSCIALLKNTTGVCITRNILSQLSANAEEDEEESTDIWVGISVNVQKEQNDELSRRQNTTLHFSQNVLGLIGIAHITSSQSDLKEVKKKFNILKEQVGSEYFCKRGGVVLLYFMCFESSLPSLTLINIT